MSIEKRKNPWGENAHLADEGAALQKAEREKARQENVAGRTAEARTAFFEKLRDTGGTLKETFELDIARSELGHLKEREFSVGLQDAPITILSFAAINDRTKWTPDSVRDAALWVNEIFPEVVFTFTEDRTRKMFGYTAVVPKKKETV